jgi:hypothetical protein
MAFGAKEILRKFKLDWVLRHAGTYRAAGSAGKMVDQILATR